MSTKRFSATVNITTEDSPEAPLLLNVQQHDDDLPVSNGLGRIGNRKKGYYGQQY